MFVGRRCWVISLDDSPHTLNGLQTLTIWMMRRKLAALRNHLKAPAWCLSPNTGCCTVMVTGHGFGQGACHPLEFGRRALAQWARIWTSLPSRPWPCAELQARLSKLVRFQVWCTNTGYARIVQPAFRMPAWAFVPFINCSRKTCQQLASSVFADLFD